MIEADPDLQQHPPVGSIVPEEETKYEPEAKFAYKPSLNLDDHSIVEKLQKMSREELLEFVNQATDEEKEKIILILNSVVEEDTKVDEEKVEPIENVTLQEKPNIQGQMPYHHMGMNQQQYQPYYGNTYMNYQQMDMQRGMNPQGQYGMYMPQQQQHYGRGGYNRGGMVCFNYNKLII